MRGNALVMMLAACALGIVSGIAHAQSFPSKPARIVVPYSPGGGNDTLARHLAQKLTEKWGQQLVVENRPGAGGNIGVEYVARSPADGYTLVIMPSDLAANPSLYRNIKYDPLKDLAPVGTVASVGVEIAAHPSAGIKSLRDLIARAKAQKGKFSYASCGSGSPAHLAAEMLKSLTGMDMVHVPYKGCGPAIVDTMAGQLPIVFNTVANLDPFIRAGKLQPLAVTTPARSRMAPDVPTVAESGFPGFDIDIWFGILAPANTPAAVVNKINGDLKALLAEPDFNKKLFDLGFDPKPGSPEQFRKLIEVDMARFGELIKRIGAHVD